MSDPPESPQINSLEVLQISFWMIIKHPILLIPQLISVVLIEILGVRRLMEKMFAPTPTITSITKDLLSNSVVAWVLGLLIIMIMSGMYPFLVQDILRGDNVNLGRAAGLVFKRFFALFFIALVIVVPITLGLFLFLIPGIIVYIQYYCAVPVLLLEKKLVFEAITTSKRFVRGKELPIFVLILVWLLRFWLFYHIDLVPFSVIVFLILSVWNSVLPSYLYLVYKANYKSDSAYLCR